MGLHSVAFPCGPRPVTHVAGPQWPLLKEIEHLLRNAETQGPGDPVWFQNGAQPLVTVGSVMAAIISGEY